MAELFKASDEIRFTMEQLIETNHPDLLLVMDEISIIFRDKATKVAGVPVLGKVSKVSAKTQLYSARRYVLELELAEDEWKKLTSRQQEAALDHYLTSMRVSENPKSGVIKVSIARPDLMMFRENIERYGLWFPSERDQESNLRFKVVRGVEESDVENTADKAA